MLVNLETSVAPILPSEAQEALRRAAATPIDKDPIARAKAIDRVIDRLRKTYPERFKDDV